MQPNKRNGVISDDQFEALLLSLRPEMPDEPLHPRVDDLKRRRVVSAVVAQWEETSKVVTAHKAKIGVKTVVAAAAAGLLMLPVIGYFVGTSMYDESSESKATVGSSLVSSEIDGDSQLVPQSRFSLLHGDVTCGDNAVKLGGSVPLGQWIATKEGQSAFALPTGIAVGLAEYSTARVFWNGNRRYEVEVNQGMALFSVDPHKFREGLFVRTPNGVIRVTGTLFSVAIQDPGAVSVSVFRGKVELQTPNQPVVYVKGGQTASWHIDAVDVDKTENAMRDVSPLYRIGCFDGGQTFSELTETECDLNSVTQSSGKKGASRGLSHSRKSASQVQHALSMAELLQSVKQARRENNWPKVAAVYRRLIREYPGTADSRTALVSLAQIELNRLNTPEVALRHFNAYLKSPGPLEREALYGKAKSCRLTGKRGEETKTLKKLIQRYPTGPLSIAAEKRLNEL